MKKLLLALIPLLMLSGCGEKTYTAKEACPEEVKTEFLAEYPTDNMNGGDYIVSVIELEYWGNNDEIIPLPYFEDDYIFRAFTIEFGFEPNDGTEPDTGLCQCDGLKAVKYLATIWYTDNHFLNYEENGTVVRISDLDIAKIIG
jgi:hypothetical protein